MKPFALLSVVAVVGILFLAGCADNPPPKGEKVAVKLTVTGGYTTTYYYPSQQRKSDWGDRLESLCCCGVPLVLVILFFIAMVIGAINDPTPAAQPRYRASHCYRCKTPVDSRWHKICFICRWIECPQCGACGCGYVRY
jgi:hypothetical protein